MLGTAVLEYSDYFFIVINVFYNPSNRLFIFLISVLLLLVSCSFPSNKGTKVKSLMLTALLPMQMHTAKWKVSNPAAAWRVDALHNDIFT